MSVKKDNAYGRVICIHPKDSKKLLEIFSNINRTDFYRFLEIYDDLTVVRAKLTKQETLLIKLSIDVSSMVKVRKSAGTRSNPYSQMTRSDLES